MPLSEVERLGFTFMLDWLSNEDLLSLQSTVTNSLVHTTDKAETIKSILSYTNNPGDLLKRKKVKKEVMLKYLHQNGVYVDGSKDKNYVARQVLQFLGSAPQEIMEIEEDDLVTIYDGDDSASRTSSIVTPSSPPTPATPSLGPEFGELFTKWFYSMLNKQHPNFASPEDFVEQNFTTSHFYCDCRLSIVRVQPGCVEDRSEYSGADNVYVTLVSLVVDSGMIFNIGGSNVLEESHGLVIVTAHGTLHLVTACVGVFEQRFQLIRDPFKENNWVIKASQLMLTHNNQINDLSSTSGQITNY